MIRRIVAGVAGFLVLVAGQALAAGALAGGLEDFKLGRAAFERGDRDIAIHHLTHAIDSDELPNPVQSLSHYFRGFLLYAKGDFEGSLPDLKQADRLGDFSDDITASVLTMKGRAYAELGDFSLALADLDAAIQLDPGSAYAREQRGHVHAMKGDYTAALQDYDELARRYPTTSSLFHDRAGIHTLAANHEQARRDYDKAIGLNPNDAQAYLSSALNHIELGNYEQARQDHETAARLDRHLRDDTDYVTLAALLAEVTSLSEPPNDAQLATAEAARSSIEHGAGLVDRGLYEQAVETLSPAIDSTGLSDAERAQALHLRGKAHAVLGRYDAAMIDLSRALKLQGDDAEIWAMRAALHYVRRDYERAMEDANSALRIDPSHARSLSIRGSSLYEFAELDRAEDDFRAALSFAPSHLGPRVGLAAVSARRGDFSAALDELGKVLDRNPDHPDALYRLAIVNEIMGNYETALPLVSRVIALAPSHDAFFTRGRVQLFLGSTKSAIQDIEEAVALAPTEAYAHLWRYLAWRRAGQNAEAELRTAAAQLDLKKWPGPLVTAYLGMPQDEGALVAAINVENKRTSSEQVCEYFFYMAEFALSNGKRPLATSLFQQAVEACPQGMIAYRAARTELEKLGM